jgi:hypothetical protein
VSAHPASHRRSWLSALVAQVSEFVFEEVEETVEPVPAGLKPHPVVAVVSAASKSGASTVARMLAAELGVRGDGAAMVISPDRARRSAPPTRAAIRLATALTGAADAQLVGRLCIAPAREGVVNAARYLAPVLIDLPPDGSAAGIAGVADHVVVVVAAAAEPALLDAVALVVGAPAIKVVNRVVEPDPWRGRADLLLPDARFAARAAAIGTRPLGPLGSAIGALADALETRG